MVAWVRGRLGSSQSWPRWDEPSGGLVVCEWAFACMALEPQRGFPHVIRPPLGGFLKPPALRVELHW